jgi:hypothetical protein
MTEYKQPQGVDSSAPICGPTSVAVLAGISLHQSMSSIRKLCGYGPKWKGGTRNPRFNSMRDPEGGDLFKALDHAGLNPRIDDDINERLSRCTFQNAVRALPKDGAYMLITGGHAQAYVDGLVFDQSTKPEGDTPAEYWGRRKKIFLVVTVDRKARKAAPKRSGKVQLTIKNGKVTLS